MASPITKPLLILAFNRPEHVKRLINSLRPYRPQKILVGVDGPREKSKSDKQKIAQVLNEVNKIDWTTDVELRIRKKNLGLRFAVADAVTWVIEKYGEVIVVEDDVVVGSEFLPFMNDMLDKFRNVPEIGHISGYSLVPSNFLSHPNERFRYSIFPESYAWATWSRSWRKFDTELQNYSLHNSLDSISRIVWSINFQDARRETINTWAYRWTNSLWKQGMLCVTPNRNLINYMGQSEGTHVRTQALWVELPIESLPAHEPADVQICQDQIADEWLSKTCYRSSPTGLIRRIVESKVLSILRFFRK
jgi:hypothetical protein